MNTNFITGEEVWVVERDEDGNVSDVTGFVFLAEVGDTAIVTPRIYDCDGVQEIMAYHVRVTAEGWDTDLAAFPMKDCYHSRYSACEARYAEQEDDDE